MRQPGALYCGACGTRFADEAAPEQPAPAAGSPAPAGDPATAAADSPYGGEMTLAAALLSLFMPVNPLIVALVMRGGELRPSRRGFLKTWAIASAAWLCTGWILMLILFVGVSSSAGGCKGGIDQLQPPSFVSSDNKHWTVIYACVDGGTKSKPWHGKVP